MDTTGAFPLRNSRCRRDARGLRLAQQVAVLGHWLFTFQNPNRHTGLRWRLFLLADNGGFKPERELEFRSSSNVKREEQTSKSSSSCIWDFSPDGTDAYEATSHATRASCYCSSSCH